MSVPWSQAVSPRLELPAGNPFGGDDLFEHALVRRFAGQKVSLVKQTAPIGAAVIVVHARRAAEEEGGGWGRVARCMKSDQR